MGAEHQEYCEHCGMSMLAHTSEGADEFVEISECPRMRTQIQPGDDKVLAAVVKASEIADERGDNWADHLPDYFRCDSKHASDPWYIGTLPDGREVWLSDESAEGTGRYRIVEGVQS